MSSSYTNFQKYKEELLSIREMYKRFDTSFVSNFIYQLSNILKSKNCKNKLNELENSFGIKIKINPLSNNKYFDSALFDILDGKYEVIFTKNCINSLLNNIDILDIIQNLEQLIVHENTHKQQYDKYNNIIKKYYNLPDNFTKEDAVKYISQKVEQDAYARQLGKKIQQRYGYNISPKKFFDMVKNGTLDNDLMEEVNTIRDPYLNLDIKVIGRFFDRLYRYLDHQEI